MATFRDGADAAHYIGQIFQVAFQTPGVGDQLAATGKKIRLELVDPTTTVNLDLGAREVSLDDASVEPDVTLQMSGALANTFWQGKANLMSALASRKIKVRGNIASLVKIQSSMDALYDVYIRILEEDKRCDLIVR